MSFDKEEKAKIRKTMELALEFVSKMRSMRDGTTMRQVCWAEVHPTGRKLKKVVPIVKCVPFDIASYMSKRLFVSGRATIITSATMSTGGTFEYVAGEIGAPVSMKCVDLPSSFDLPNVGRMFVPKRQETWGKKYDEETCKLVRQAIDATPGGVLCLFTSYRVMHKVAEKLGDLPYKGRKVLVQGDLPRTKLLEVFRKDRTSVLLGTRSFFEGVDVPGDALQCVVIDKLPFPVPTDPVVAAIQNRHEMQGKNGWAAHSLPLACLTVAQAAGRLIRRSTDKGAVVLLDERVVTKGYGKKVLQSLPPYPMIRSGDEFVQFMATLG